MRLRSNALFHLGLRFSVKKNRPTFPCGPLFLQITCSLIHCPNMPTAQLSHMRTAVTAPPANVLAQRRQSLVHGNAQLAGATRKVAKVGSLRPLPVVAGPGVAHPGEVSSKVSLNCMP
jgi:hypothetical protein